VIDLGNLKPVITRPPKEAIAVLFDVSGSMGGQFFNEPDLKRIGAVKSFFEAFAYRTIAYNLEHVVSLFFFDHNV
jgi:ubiquitin-conjugating enzyme E2 D/E